MSELHAKETGQNESIGTLPLPTVARPKSSYIPALDGIRGIAILMVMFYHFTDPTLGGGPLLKLFKLGVSGVDLFFVLSGFLITGILFDAKSNPYYFRNFYIRRSLRIFPLYYGVLIAVLVVLPQFHVIVDPVILQHQAWLWSYLSNFLVGGSEVTTLNRLGHFWSLAVEEQFYLVWPLMIFCCSRKAGMVLCVSCVLLSIGSRIHAVAENTAETAHRITYSCTQCRMEALAVGAFLALAARGPTGSHSLIRCGRFLAAATALLLGLLVVNHMAARLPMGSLDVTRYSLCAWIAGVLVILAVVSPPSSRLGRLIGSRFLRFFGKYSYGLYVFHWLLLPIYKQLFPAEQLIARLGSPLAGQLSYIVLAIGMSVVAAQLSWHLFEKHFLGLKDKLAPTRVETLTESCRAQPLASVSNSVRAAA